MTSIAMSAFELQPTLLLLHASRVYQVETEGSFALQACGQVLSFLQHLEADLLTYMVTERRHTSQHSLPDLWYCYIHDAGSLACNPDAP